MLEVREHEIYKFLMKNGDGTKVSEICEILEPREETKGNIEERISTMAKYGIIIVDREGVSIPWQRRQQVKFKNLDKNAVKSAV